MNAFYLIAFAFAVMYFSNFGSTSTNDLMYLSVAMLFFILGMDEKKKKDKDKK